MKSAVVKGVFAGAALTLTLALGGCTETGNRAIATDLLNAMLSPSAGLDQQTVANGLKEALRVGTERAVGATSQAGGFLNNELIRIAMPEQLKTAASTLRAVGFGGQVDAFERGMNKAAEKASEEATPVFVDAISEMTLADAMGILNGGDTAATDYFRDKTSATLKSRFMPIIEDKMSQVGLYQQYNQLMDSYNALPLTTKPTFDLDDYVSEQGLDGLFTVLGQEEKNIRQNPAARTTELLQKVFASK